MATTQKLVIKVGAEDQSKGVFSKVEQHLKQLQMKGGAAGAAMNAAFGAAAAGVAVMAAAMIGRGVRAMNELQKAGEQARQVGMAFAHVFGVEAAEALEKFQKASAGVSEATELQGIANKLRQVGFSVDEIGIAMDTALRIAVAQGKEFAAVANQLAQGLVTGRTQSLQSLGIVVSLAEAQEVYAKSIGKTVGELTELEKKQAALQAAGKTVGAVFGEMDTASVIRANQQLRTELGNIWSDITEEAASLGDAISAPIMAAIQAKRDYDKAMQTGADRAVSSRVQLMEQLVGTGKDAADQAKQISMALGEMERMISARLTPSFSRMDKETQQAMANMAGDTDKARLMWNSLLAAFAETGTYATDARVQIIKTVAALTKQKEGSIELTKIQIEQQRVRQAELEATTTWQMKQAQAAAKQADEWLMVRGKVAELEARAAEDLSQFDANHLTALRLQLQSLQEMHPELVKLESDWQAMAATQAAATAAAKDAERAEHIKSLATAWSGVTTQLIANGEAMGELTKRQAVYLRLQEQTAEIQRQGLGFMERQIALIRARVTAGGELIKISQEEDEAAKQQAESNRQAAIAASQERARRAQDRINRLQDLTQRSADLKFAMGQELGFYDEQSANVYAREKELTRIRREGMDAETQRMQEKIALQQYALAEEQRRSRETLEAQKQTERDQAEHDRAMLELAKERARQQQELDRSIAQSRRENALQAAAALQIATQGINAQAGAMASAFVQASVAQENYAEAEKQGAAAAQAAAPGLISAYGSVAGAMISNTRAMAFVRGAFETAAAFASGAIGDFRGATLHGLAAAAFFVAAAKAGAQKKNVTTGVGVSGSAQTAQAATQPRSQSGGVMINYYQTGATVGTMQQLGEVVTRSLNLAAPLGVKLNPKLISAQGDR